MAVNETTGIDYEVDRFVVIPSGETQSSHQNALWPRFDGGPVSGGLNGAKWYKRVNVDPPVYDHRYTLSSVFAGVDADPAAAEGHPTGEWKATYTLTKRPVEELKAQVETEFQRQLQVLFPTSSNPAVLIEAADAIARKQANAQLTADQQAQLDLVQAVGDGVALLRVRQAELNDAIDNDEDYDLTTGWVEEETEE